MLTAGNTFTSTKEENGGWWRLLGPQISWRMCVDFSLWAGASADVPLWVRWDNDANQHIPVPPLVSDFYLLTPRVSYIHLTWKTFFSPPVLHNEPPLCWLQLKELFFGQVQFFLKAAISSLLFSLILRMCVSLCKSVSRSSTGISLRLTQIYF